MDEKQVRVGERGRMREKERKDERERERERKRVGEKRRKVTIGLGKERREGGERSVGR